MLQTRCPKTKTVTILYRNKIIHYLNFWNFSDPIVEVNAVVRHFRHTKHLAMNV
jgi:hypothetical protein